MLSELNKYHGLPNGMFSCDEHLAGLDPSQGSETVLGRRVHVLPRAGSLAITGDPSLGDRLEQLAFNALPGTFTDDMWAHQYNQEPNQVECSLHHKPWTTMDPNRISTASSPTSAAAPPTSTRVGPSSPTASSCSPAPRTTTPTMAWSPPPTLPVEVHTVLRGTQIHVIEETNYPFRGTVRLTINPASPLSFPLQLRIPAWASGASIAINGKPQPAPAAGSFARIRAHLAIRRPRRDRLPHGPARLPLVPRLHRRRTRTTRLFLRHWRELGKAPQTAE